MPLETKNMVSEPIGRAVKWGGLPLYCVVLLQGLPLGRHLTSARSRLEQDVEQQLVDRVTTVGVMNSLLPAVVWTTIYTLAIYLLTRPSSAFVLRRLLTRQWPLVALVALSISSVIWSPNTGKVVASSFHAAGITLVAMAAAIRCSANASSFLKAVSIAFCVNLLAHLACIVIAPDIGIAVDGRWMGMSTHSNTLGGFAWTGAWVSLAASAQCRGKQRLVTLGCLAVALLLLAGSVSSTSIVAAIIALVLILFLRMSSRWRKELRQLAYVACACVLMGIIAAITAFGQSIDVFTEIFGKTSTFTGRDVIWQSAWRLIVQHPLLGWGFDDNARVIVETGFNHTSYHNGYLDLAVRGGVVALVFLMIGFVMFGHDLLRAGRAWRSLVVPMMVAFLIYNLMEVRIFSPRSSIWLVMSAIMFSTALLASKSRRQSSL